MEISWKAFKHCVKDFYKIFETDAECLANVPPRVESRQWPTLVTYWSLDDTKNKYKHIRGGWKRSMSTLSTCGELLEENVAVIMKKTKQLVRRKKRRIEELPMEERDNEDQLNKVYKEVVGQDGNNRVLGQQVGIRKCGKCSTSQIEVEKSTNAEIEQLQKDAEKLREETEALRRERDEQETRHAKELEMVRNDLKSECDDQEARHKKELEKVKSELSTEIKAQVAIMFANALLLPQTPNTSASTIFG